MSQDKPQDAAAETAANDTTNENATTTDAAQDAAASGEAATADAAPAEGTATHNEPTDSATTAAAEAAAPAQSEAVATDAAADAPTAQADAGATADTGASKAGSDNAPAAAAEVDPDEAAEQQEQERRKEMAAMLDQFETSKPSETPAVGTKVKGKIVQIGEDTCFVDFGGRSEGAVETKHLVPEGSDSKPEVGDEVELYIVADGDQIILAPTVTLQPSEAVQAIIEARQTKTPISGKVNSINSGGLEVSLSGQRAFCPFSQIEEGYCAEPSGYLGQTLEFLVQDVTDNGKNIVVSRRALLRRESKAKGEQLLASLEPGQMLEGKVVRIQPFGAFVNIGGLEGLVHVSEIRHGRVENPSDALKPGQNVRVKVLRVEQQEGKKKPRIGLSIKAAEPDPWDEIAEQFWAGKKTTGTVARLQDFGAFVELVPGVDGLVHVSQIAHKRIQHPKDELKVGQQVDVSVLSVDKEKKRISLSIKELLEVDPETAAASAESNAPRRQAKVGDILDGVIANIKPYGLFVDLPDYGPRTRGLCPHEETGERRGTELDKRFEPGAPVKVAVIDVQADGKIRLSMTAVQKNEERAAFDSYRQSSRSTASPGGSNTAMADAFKKAMAKNKS